MFGNAGIAERFEHDEQHPRHRRQSHHRKSQSDHNLDHTGLTVHRWDLFSASPSRPGGRGAGPCSDPGTSFPGGSSDVDNRLGAADHQQLIPLCGVAGCFPLLPHLPGLPHPHRGVADEVTFNRITIADGAARVSWRRSGLPHSIRRHGSLMLSCRA